MNNPDAERAVISLALSNPIAYDKANLESNDFFIFIHSVIWQAIGELISQGVTIDIITVCEWLERNGHDILPADVATIAATQSTKSGLKHYVKLVTNAAKERGLLTMAHEIAEIVHTQKISTEEKIDRVDSLFTSTAPGEQSAPEQINSAIKQTIDLIEQRFNSKGLSGLPTGIDSLDDRTQGFGNSQLIILAARPAMGKTALALNLATHAAVNLNKPVLFFSLEMAKTELVERAIASTGSIDYKSIRTGNLSDDQWSGLSAGIQAIKDKPLIVDDTAGLTLAQIRGRARAQHRKSPLSLIVVDYLQLVRLSGRSKNEEVGEISRSLKELAKELDIPVLCLSQLNRGCEERADKRPKLSDLRDSGSVEQDADIVLFIYRDEIYNEDTDHKGIAELITRKIRAGETGTDFVEADLRHQRFKQLSHKIEQIPQKPVFQYKS